MIIDKIIQEDFTNFKPNRVYLMSKENNTFILVITDNQGTPAYPYNQAQINVSLLQGLHNEQELENVTKTNSISLYKPHLDFKILENEKIIIKMSDNIMSAIANSYKKINSPNPNKTYAIGIDGKPLDLQTEIKEVINYNDKEILGIKKVLTIPNGFKKIADNAFNSKSIDTVHIPTSVVEIGHYSFINNNIEIITLPAFCNYYNDSFDSTVIITGGKLIE